MHQQPHPTTTHASTPRPPVALDVTEHHGRLFSIARRMLGSAAEAEDAVQDAFLRWIRARPGEIHNPAAYLNTLLVRVCIDGLRSPRRKRTVYGDRALREPATVPEDVDSGSVSNALGKMLRRLTGPQRAVYVLHDIFGFSFREVSAMTGKSVPNCRQISHRARQHMGAGPRFSPTPHHEREMLGSFLHACRTGDVAPMCKVLMGGVATPHSPTRIGSGGPARRERANAHPDRSWPPGSNRCAGN